jgi:hypothetical protein
LQDSRASSVLVFRRVERRSRHHLKSTVLIPVADPLFRYAALQRPNIYLAFIWSFAIFLFTTPFLMLSMCFSLLYIHFYEEETAETLGTLPEYPFASCAVQF